MKSLSKLALLSTILITGHTFALQAKPVKISILMYGMKAEFVQLMEKAAKQHPAVRDGEVQLTIYDGRYDPLVQNNQAETAIQTKTDAIIINPMDYEANVDVVIMANTARIPVIVTNARLNTDKMTAEVISDDVLGGYMEAKAVLQKMHCEGSLVIFQGPIGGSGEIQRGQGINKTIAECNPDKIKILARQTANWSRAQALTLMENWLQKYRGKINGIIAQNDEMALGAIEAIKGAGLNVKDFSISGIDGVSDALRAVKAGEMVSVLQDANAQMQGAIDVALRAVKGADYQLRSAIWQQYADKLKWDNGTDKHYYIPWTEVTTANAQELLDARQENK